jgi:hypothetical protein
MTEVTPQLYLKRDLSIKLFGTSSLLDKTIGISGKENL